MSSTSGSSRTSSCTCSSGASTGALPFLFRYFGEYLRSRARGMRHWAAYAAISFEAEARARSGA